MGFVDLKNMPELTIAEGITGRAVTADTLTVMHVVLKAGAIIPEHSHYHEQVVNVIEGEMELVVDGQPHRLVPGNAMVLAPNVVHSGKVISECKVVDVFHPVRKDFAGSSFGGYRQK